LITDHSAAGQNTSGCTSPRRPGSLRDGPFPGSAPVVKARQATRRVVDAEAVAGNLAAMSLGRAQAREERMAAEAVLLERVSGMSLEELHRSSSARQWLAALGQAPTGSCAIPSRAGSCSSSRITSSSRFSAGSGVRKQPPKRQPQKSGRVRRQSYVDHVGC
jgi:hypothetical protein